MTFDFRGCRLIQFGVTKKQYRDSLGYNNYASKDNLIHLLSVKIYPHYDGWEQQCIWSMLPNILLLTINTFAFKIIYSPELSLSRRHSRTVASRRVRIVKACITPALYIHKMST